MTSKPITIQPHEVKNQRTSVMMHLKEKGSINSWEAIKDYGITRLASIICNLRKQGYYITSHDITFTNRFGGNGRYSNYQYVEPKVAPTNSTNEQKQTQKQTKDIFLLPELNRGDGGCFGNQKEIPRQLKK